MTKKRPKRKLKSNRATVAHEINCASVVCMYCQIGHGCVVPVRVTKNAAREALAGDDLFNVVYEVRGSFLYLGVRY